MNYKLYTNQGRHVLMAAKRIALEMGASEVSMQDVLQALLVTGHSQGGLLAAFDVYPGIRLTDFTKRMTPAMEKKVRGVPLGEFNYVDKLVSELCESFAGPQHIAKAVAQSLLNSKARMRLTPVQILVLEQIKMQDTEEWELRIDAPWVTDETMTKYGMQNLSSIDGLGLSIVAGIYGIADWEKSVRKKFTLTELAEFIDISPEAVRERLNEAEGVIAREFLNSVRAGKISIVESA